MASARSRSVTSVNLAISLPAGAGADGVLFSVSLFLTILVAFVWLIGQRKGNNGLGVLHWLKLFMSVGGVLLIPLFLVKA